ncbi:MAG: SprB repeat-containing protein, partial [Bacteroidota bacterium]
MKATCSQSCDGKAKILHNNGDETLLYEWLSHTNQMISQSFFPEFKNACAGDYKARIVKKKDITSYRVDTEPFEDYNPIRIIQFSARSRMKISLGFEIKAKKYVAELNDDLQIYYSLDQGSSWKKAGDIYPLKSNFSGLEIPSLVYSTILPSSVDQQGDVMVMVAARNNAKMKKLKSAIKKSSFEIFHVYRKYVPFKIDSKSKVEVNSYVSHELYGNDGLIALQVSGGLPPYSYEWNVGSNLSSIGKLSPGEYSVVIRDSKACELKKSYRVKALYNPIDPELDIKLTKANKPRHFYLRINNIYDKIIYLYI